MKTRHIATSALLPDGQKTCATFASEVRSLPRVFASSPRIASKKKADRSPRREGTVRSVIPLWCSLCADLSCFARSAKITDGAHDSQKEKGRTACNAGTQTLLRSIQHVWNVRVVLIASGLLVFIQKASLKQDRLVVAKDDQDAIRCAIRGDQTNWLSRLGHRLTVGTREVWVCPLENGLLSKYSM
jgi:hypothetical protein